MLESAAGAHGLELWTRSCEVRTENKNQARDAAI